MSVIRSISRLVVLAAVLTPLAHAQVSSSTNFQLADFVLAEGGGGMASLNFGGYVSVGMGETLRASPNFQAGVGFLNTSDPVPQNAPVIFGLTPDFANYAGGSSITVSGWNFNKFGVGPSVTMSVGGNPATSLSVLSNTQLTANVPAGTPGPQGVVVTSSLGSGSDPDAWIYSPAVVTTQFTQVGGEMFVRNYGTNGNSFIEFVSASGGFANTQFGPFLLGSPFQLLFYGIPYPTGGIHTLHVNVPNMPILSGLTVHFQSFEATQFGPIQGKFTNASTVTFP